MKAIITLFAVIISLSLLSAIGVYRLLTANERRKQRKQGMQHPKKEYRYLPLKDKWVLNEN